MRIGSALIVAGLSVAAVGVVLRYAPWAVSWFGKLPGDIRVERNSTRVFVPITSMLLVSLVLSVILTLVSRFRS